MGIYKMEVDMRACDGLSNMPVKAEVGKDYWWGGGNSRVRNAGFEREMQGISLASYYFSLVSGLSRIGI